MLTLKKIYYMIFIYSFKFKDNYNDFLQILVISIQNLFKLYHELNKLNYVFIFY